MTLFVLTCLDRKGALDVRMAARPAHLEYVAANKSMVKLAGPLLSDEGEMAGSMFIIEAEDKAAVEAFSAADPYVLAGLFESTTLRSFRATVGGLA